MGQAGAAEARRGNRSLPGFARRFRHRNRSNHGNAVGDRGLGTALALGARPVSPSARDPAGKAAPDGEGLFLCCFPRRRHMSRCAKIICSIIF